MNIRFFDDPLESPNSREDVRIKQLGLFVFEDKRRVAVGFDITPFLERPSIDVDAVNANGQFAGTMTIVNANAPNFTLTLHLRDKEPTDSYTIRVTLYYASPESDRQDVHTLTRTVDVTRPGTQ